MGPTFSNKSPPGGALPYAYSIRAYSKYLKTNKSHAIVWFFAVVTGQNLIDDRETNNEDRLSAVMLHSH
jgi:hypothetical protein